MTVVKFSILTLLAGGFCTLLGIGMWMGPQETACNAQSGVTTVAVADSAAPIRSCWSQPAGIACEAQCASETIACDSGACIVLACTDNPGESGACDLALTPAPVEPSPWPTQSPAPQAVVASLPLPTYGSVAPLGMCDANVCTAPGGSFLGYANPYGVATAYAAPMPAPSPYTAYPEPTPQMSGQPSMEMIEAFMQEREKRYEAQVEALQAQMELKLEAQEAILKAEHEVAMAKLHAEAFVKLAGMEQALREDKALLALVAEGTLTTDALRSILAKNHANGNGESAQPVSTAAGRSCEKEGCENCRRCESEVSTAGAACECDGTCCPACETAVSTVAPTCSACKATACEAPVSTTAAPGECKTSACGKSCEAANAVSAECKRQGDCPAACEKAVSTAAPDCSACKTSACEAPVSTSAGNCAASASCAKSCEASTKAPKSLERIGVEFDFEGEKCTILSDGIPMAVLGDGCTMTAQDLVCIGAAQSPDGRCTIAFGQKAAECAKGECKTVEFSMGKKPVAVETKEAPFVCEQDGCTLEVHVTEVPFLSDIPYVGRLFRNVGIAVDETNSAEAAQR